ncbi:MAG: RNA 2',3'-cyclic phosphodiesterase [Bacteroidales bacterium]|nr:RNA 2',3'-cyclic phosphodiesterase [Bacteroidales bacterium]
MKRLFVAVKIIPSDSFLEVYEHMMDAFHYDKISWANPDNVHITIKFLGDTEEGNINRINEVLENCAKEIDPFDIHIENVGIFGSSYDPKIIWFGIKENNALLDLSENILNGLDLIGFKRDRQNFRPHLTVGRVKKINNRKNFQKRINHFKGLKIQNSRIDSFALYESILKPTGAEHFVIRRFPLIASDC